MARRGARGWLDCSVSSRLVGTVAHFYIAPSVVAAGPDDATGVLSNPWDFQTDFEPVSNAAGRRPESAAVVVTVR
jgi:hypothetical protein